MISLLIAKKEFMRSLKNKKRLALMILVPLITIVAAISVNTLMKPSINLGVIGNTEGSSTFTNKVNNIERLKVSEANKESINTDMILAKYIAVVEFSQGNDFKVHSLDENVDKTIEFAVAETINTGNVDTIEGLLEILDEGSLTAAERSSGFIFMTLMITCITVACTMIKDKEDGVLTRFSISGNKISSYILGNFIYNLISTSIQVIISVLLIYLLKIDMGISIGLFLVVALLIVLIATSLTTLIAVVSNSELQGSLIVSTLALIISLFGGAFLPVDKMPEALKLISNLSVTKWIMDFTGNIESGIFSGNNLIIIVGTLVFITVSIYLGIIIGNKKLIN